MATTERPTASRNGGSHAERHAQKQREKLDEKRKKADGAAGWVADRAGQWGLEDFDPDFMEQQKYFWNPLMD